MLKIITFKRGKGKMGEVMHVLHKEVAATVQINIGHPGERLH